MKEFVAELQARRLLRSSQSLLLAIWQGRRTSDPFRLRDRAQDVDERLRPFVLAIRSTDDALQLLYEVYYFIVYPIARYDQRDAWGTHREMCDAVIKNSKEYLDRIVKLRVFC